MNAKKHMAESFVNLAKMMGGDMSRMGICPYTGGRGQTQGNLRVLNYSILKHHQNDKLT